MTEKRKIEIYSAGCPVCAETINLVNKIACPSCEIFVYDMHDNDVAERANKLGVKTVPAVVINGELLKSNVNGINESSLRQAGVGQPI
jgi:glutaredoxin